MSADRIRVAIYSPPHRWLRNALADKDTANNNSPPHRWLRNFYKCTDEML
ncbi:hypothetical protein [uncultured Gammaproteobacteria bacterium]|nr:hypothetical protein [uncultured Gammaproteobacteria bacterium]CAC9642447.1 hypothetical protein [uncultured Gammaproteobacteria bacterium]CAC9643744.1 hypothetical protein [uncultured Gammaproteobacteria bacterium]CAC9984886.1 hypothetical protein [uncultured Gammaproteobacteria bacterium]